MVAGTPFPAFEHLGLTILELDTSSMPSKMLFQDSTPSIKLAACVRKPLREDEAYLIQDLHIGCGDFPRIHPSVPNS